MPEVAILTPVPHQHLRSGLEVPCGIVALGSDEPEFFERVDEMRGNAPVKMLLYAASKGSPDDGVYRASWTGWYVGSVPAQGGKHPAGAILRPPSTSTDGEFKLFYHVAGLRELTYEEQVSIQTLQKHGKPGEYRSNARVRGPGLVAIRDV